MPKPTASRPALVSVSFNCPAELADRLAALANAQGVSLASFVAGLVVTPLCDQLAETSPDA